MAQSTLLRQITMLKLIPKAPAFILTKRLHQALENESFKVSKRTVERDLKTLMDIMGLKSCDSPEGYKWSYELTNTELLPSMQPSEALLLNIAQQQLAHSLPTKALAQLEPRFKKAQQTLNKSPELLNWQEKICVLPHGYPLIKQMPNEKIREQIYQAVLGNSQIKLIYQKRRNEPVSDYLLNPHGLIIRDYIQYLVATKAQTPDKFQLFRISRIKKVTDTYHAIDVTKSDLSAFYQTNASGFVLVEQAMAIKLHVAGPLANLLSENKLSIDQTFTWLDDELRWAEITATVYISFDLIHLLIGYGKWVEVQTPQVLIDEMDKQLK